MPKRDSQFAPGFSSFATPIDPLEWENPRTLQFDDGQVSIKINDEGNTITDVIRVKLAILAESTEGEAVITQNYKNQGFYILRNNREVLDAVTLDFFTKHPDFNRFRGEIHFTGTLDKFMGVNFTKRDVALHQSLFDQLNQYLQGRLKTIRSRLRKAQQAEQRPMLLTFASRLNWKFNGSLSFC